MYVAVDGLDVSDVGLAAAADYAVVVSAECYVGTGTDVISVCGVVVDGD